MKTLNVILGCLILAAFLLPLFAAASQTVQVPDLLSLKFIRRALGLNAGILRVNALTDGVHKNGVLGHLLADAAHTARYLLVKRGSDAGHFAVSGAADIPMGVCLDEPSAAESPGAVRLLGVGEGTVLMVASEAMATPDVNVYSAAGGKIALQGRVKVGVLRTTATGDGDTCEVEPCLPVVEPNGVTTKAGAALAVPVTHRSVTMTTGGAEALTLANGIPGQRLQIRLGTDGGDGTLTPATKTGFGAIVFADAGDTVELLFLDTTAGWIITGYAGAAAPPVITL